MQYGLRSFLSTESESEFQKATESGSVGAARRITRLMELSKVRGGKSLKFRDLRDSSNIEQEVMVPRLSS